MSKVRHRDVPSLSSGYATCFSKKESTTSIFVIKSKKTWDVNDSTVLVRIYPMWQLEHATQRGAMLCFDVSHGPLCISLTILLAYSMRTKGDILTVNSRLTCVGEA